MTPNRLPLRAKAETKLAHVTRPDAPGSAAEELLHELQVHQIELELQNEELQHAQLALEESRDRYLDLYEFAPVGYFTLTDKALISEVNLAGAKLLGEERKSMLQRRFARFVTREDSDRYHQLIGSVLRHGERETCDLALRRSDGAVIQVQLDCVCLSGGGKPRTLRLALTDITERKRAEADIEQLAFYDPMTRLPNRRLLLDRLQQALTSRARSQRRGAILFLDLDEFKCLNDTLGHDAGDLLLQQVALRLLSCVRACDTVARLGGDEFVVMLGDLSANPRDAASQAELVGEKILLALALPSMLAGHEHHSTGCIGVTLFGDRRETVHELMKRADLAMYRAKAVGHNSLRFFDPEMQAAVDARAALEADLRSGMQEGQFVVHYQPQVDGRGRLTGAEALVRWQHPRLGLAAPAVFIPLAEETGLIQLLGQRVLETVCAQLVAWNARPETAHLTLAMNVSPREFRRPEFVSGVLGVIDRAGADPTKLVLEFTESLLVDDMQETITKMNALKSRGVRFSLDDFGTGYSSLSYLKHLPLNQLKIDRSFVHDILVGSSDAAITFSIIALGRSLGLAVLAEGVESEAQRLLLARQGCHAFQGFHFGRPGPMDSLQATANSETRRPRPSGSPPEPLADLPLIRELAQHLHRRAQAAAT
jgi:diguanylate cyclase (GGDEF)-like protein/PAS domain S-box-containing protein